MVDAAMAGYDPHNLDAESRAVLAEYNRQASSSPSENGVQQPSGSPPLARQPAPGAVCSPAA